MSKRRDTPALFELVRSSGIKRPESGQHENPLRPVPGAEKTGSITDAAKSAVSPTQSTSHEPTTFGRTIRLPMGYVFLAVAALIVLLVMAYSVGFSRGRAEGRAENANLAGFSQAGGEQNPEDSGVAGTENSDQNQRSPRSNNDFETTQAQNETQNTPPVQRNQPSERSSTNPARSEDTRQSGLNYIIVEQFDPGEADAVADFLLARGIDVMVLPTNNRNLRLVVVRTGYRGWSSNQAGQAMLRQIRDLGLTWASNGQGTKNFRQAYGQRFN